LKTYNCIIVDDETLAQELIEVHLAKISSIHIIAKCHTAIEAMDVINNYHVDIMFLDIQMPDITGVEFLKSLDTAPLTILTTAYSEYAIEGYELNVIDYLLKPIRFDRFFKAIVKVLSILKEANDTIAIENMTLVKDDYIFVKSDYKAIKVSFNELVYVESMQKYVKFYLKDKMVMSLMSLTSLEEILPSSSFFRCQKSFIVNLTKIESIEGNQLLLNNGTKIPVSKNLKSELVKLIDKNNLL
jgi:DNA-binding LytR/AlgR family response regulator